MVYTINNKEYVLVKVPLADKSIDEIISVMKQHNCIVQDWEIMVRGFFLSHKIKISVLVPSENIEKFNEQLYNNNE